MGNIEPSSLLHVHDWHHNRQTARVRAASKNPLAFIWREYGKADSRWDIFDPTVATVELVTGTRI